MPSDAPSALARPPSPGAPAAAPLRLRHVDSLRAVAAGAVMWTHFAELLRPRCAPGPAFLGALVTLPPAVNLGRVGVMIFFAVSGFVICRSFGGGPREGGARRFVIRRFCRLYPAFWASLPLGAWVWWTQGRPLTVALLAANATMAPGLFGQPFLLGVYWTLQIELAFYALCLGLHRAGWLDRRAALWSGALALAAFPHVWRTLGRWLGLPLALPGEGDTWMIALAVMCWGAAFRLVYDETGGFRRGVFTRRGPWLLALVTLALCDLHHPGFKRLLLPGSGGPAPAELGSILALAAFVLWVACLRVDNRSLTFLGVISYSLYLLHPAVLCLALAALACAGKNGLPPTPLWAALAGCALLTAALAAAAYRWVERPAIALGKRWVGAPRLPAAAPPPGTAMAE